MTPALPGFVYPLIPIYIEVQAVRISMVLYVENPAPTKSSLQGLPFTQLFEHFPMLEPFYSSVEKKFMAAPYFLWSQKTWPAVPLAFVAAYVLMITVGPWYMKDRKPFNLKGPLALWNLSLSIFSFCGMVRCAPHLLHNIATKPLRDTICTHPEIAYGEGAVGMWTMLFIFSKVPELVDTFFIVARKSVSGNCREELSCIYLR